MSPHSHESADGEDPRIIVRFPSPISPDEGGLLTWLPEPSMVDREHRLIIAYWDQQGRIVVRRREGQTQYTHEEVYSAVRELLFRTLGPRILGEFPVARSLEDSPRSLPTIIRKLLRRVFSSRAKEPELQQGSTAYGEVERLSAWLRDHAESVMEQLRDFRDSTMELHKYANAPRACAKILLERDEQPGTYIHCFLNGRKTCVQVVNRKKLVLDVDTPDGRKRFYSNDWELSAVTESYLEGIHFGLDQRFFILSAGENAKMAIVQRAAADHRVEWDGERYLDEYGLRELADDCDDGAGEEWKNI